MHHRWTVLALSLLFASPVLGQTPRLVKDINTLTLPQSSSPESFVPTQSLVYFTAEDPETGRELWRTDGTLAGTFQVVDACPDRCGGGGTSVARDGDRFFFVARDGSGIASLWVTGGTPASTFRLTGAGTFLSVDPGWRLWIPEQRLLYFAASNGGQGLELWRSDGTAAGTFQIVDVRPGSFGSQPSEMTNAGGRLFFVAADDRGSVYGRVTARPPAPGWCAAPIRAPPRREAPRGSPRWDAPSFSPRRSRRRAGSSGRATVPPRGRWH